MYKNAKPNVRAVTLNQEKGMARLTVSDQGIGINKEHLPFIFDKFYRVPTGDVHNVKGFGLGLFYVKNICDTHHWKLKLESENGVGTTISIGIPISPN